MIIALITFAILLLLLPAEAMKWELKPKHFSPWSLLMASLGFVITYAGANYFGTLPSVGFQATGHRQSWQSPIHDRIIGTLKA